MKVFTTILMVIALGLIIFNLTQIDFNKPFEGDSIAALIGVVASFCAVCILLIFRMSKKIQTNLKR
ncbi:MAG TPA: hypothetical protein PKN96_02105 [Flavobacterium sp.]|uniref:hypothetical protein n=1 Tax=Flavobacterium sp. TaxID=239 RepID=UPI002D06ED10|nr:hypothetical protein [Flavobacterium sp.]HNP32067.1 hypothetical protein [Flavobacterium sp.]